MRPFSAASSARSKPSSICHSVRSSVIDVGPSRRQGLLLVASGSLCAPGLVAGNEARAGILTKARPKKVPLDDYKILENGLKYYDLEPGSGAEIQNGDKVTVHFDCYIGVVDAVSSRYSTLLGKNEIIPEPYDFTAGRPVSGRKAKVSDSGLAGGSFSGMGGPKPPPALSTSVVGMKVGGKRSVIVTADQGYGDGGFEEIPGGANFEMQIEVLNVSKA